MIESVSKRITKFYQASLLVAILATLFTILYFWKLGFIDGSRGKELHKASFILESYESKKPLNEIKSLIKNENPKLAIVKIKDYQRQLEKVNQQVEVEEFSRLKKNLQELKKDSAKLISYSKTVKVVSVFNLKMDKFYDYVKSKNWRTLTRMSQRVFSQTKGYVNKSKLNNLIKNVNRDFTSMISITERSILSRNDKAEVLSRIQNLKTEIKMLAKYQDSLSNFNSTFAKLENSIGKWYQSVAPEVTLQKLEVEQIGRYYVMGFVGILALLTSTFLVSFLFNKWFFSKAQKELELKFEELVSEGMLENKMGLFDDFSIDFKNYAQSMSKYFEKRMSFGSIFQETLPLSSILLDKNLKVAWANKQFCEDWNISEEEVKKDYMSWDFLNKLTNIGVDDPVLEALKHNVAGIYQIMIKANDESEVRPFEMFVSPYEYQGETKIMLFFYDLTNLEQTIQDQAKGILNPVKASIKQLECGKFEPTEELEHSFNIAKIADIYDQFISLDSKYKEKNFRLNDQIEYLHSRVEELEDTVSEIQDKNSMSIETSRENVNCLKIFKENVIGLSTLSRELDELTSKEQELVYTNIAALKVSLKKINDLKGIGSELIDSMPRYNLLKDEIRSIKSSVYESKSKLSHELSQLTILLKRANDANAIEKLSRTISKINVTFNELNTYSDNLDKKISNLELVMSKSGMILNSNKEKISVINSDYENQQITFSENQANLSKKIKASSSIKLDDYESNIIGSLQGIFKGTKGSIALGASINELIKTSDNHYVEETVVNETFSAKDSQV